ncbi:hypothetical protein FXO38_02694 [Capsicum annuum]|nr:hypothetical protein FXO37_06046 [Capsicum annuum]KAF3679582.1 hypothetical protein FXO38_02694 [Capsicum annuum]
MSKRWRRVKLFSKRLQKKSVNAKRLLKLIIGGRLDKEDKFKFCLVWFVHCIFLARDLSKTVDIDTIKMMDNLGFFERYPSDLNIRSLFLPRQGNGKSTEDPLPISRWNTSKGYKLIEGDPYLNEWSTKRVHPYLIPTVREMKQHYMKKFKAFTDEPKDAFIDGLKAHLEGMTVITSSEDGEDGDDDRDLSRNAVSRYVTRGVEMSKPRVSRKTPMIENLEERVFRMEESIKDITNFVKEKRLRRAKKEKQKKRDEAEATLEQASINADEVMILEVASVVGKKNLNEGDEEKEEEKNKDVVCEEENKVDGSTGVEKEDHDEGRQNEHDKNEKK